MTVSINTFDIPNIDVKVWTSKSDFPQGSFLRSSTQPEIKRQRPFELTDIEYDIIKYEIERVRHAEYNTYIGRNFINVDDI